MTRIARIFVRIALSLLGAVAMYVLVYGLTGWASDQFGYQSAIGRMFGFVNGALSPLALAIFAIPAFAFVIFLLLSRFAFVNHPPQDK